MRWWSPPVPGPTASYHAVEKVVGRASWVVLALVVVAALFLVVRWRLRTPVDE